MDVSHVDSHKSKKGQVQKKVRFVRCARSKTKLRKKEGLARGWELRDRALCDEYRDVFTKITCANGRVLMVVVCLIELWLLIAV